MKRNKMNTTNLTNEKPNWNNLYKIGAISVLVQLGVVLVIMLVATALGLGPRPTTAQEFFTMYQENKLTGILRDDFTGLFLVAMYLGSIPALFLALRRVNASAAMFASLFTLVAVVICFATHSGFSLIHLSDQYAAAASEAQRAQLLAAGEAVIASDMWNSSGAYLSGILLQGSGILFSLVMLRSKDFSKVTAFSGMLGNGLDLVQHLLHPFAPAISTMIQPFMGIFYLVWFPMLARDLLRLAHRETA
jgi:hypothetical protein